MSLAFTHLFKIVSHVKIALWSLLAEGFVSATPSSKCKMQQMLVFIRHVCTCAMLILWVSRFFTVHIQYTVSTYNCEVDTWPSLPSLHMSLHLISICLLHLFCFCLSLLNLLIWLLTYLVCYFSCISLCAPHDYCGNGLRWVSCCSWRPDVWVPCGSLFHLYSQLYTKFEKIALSRELETHRSVFQLNHLVTKLCASVYCMCVHHPFMLIDAVLIGRLTFVNACWDSLESTTPHT